MKTIFKMMLLTAALTTVWGCSSDDKESDGGNNTFSTVEKPSWKVDLTGHEDKPDWTMPDAADYESDMFLLVRLQDELAALSSDDDCMAVFINGECRGLTEVRNTADDGGYYFLLKIHGNNADLRALLTLSYYSAQLKQLFTLPAIDAFVPERTRGFDKDFVPSLLDGCAKYPVHCQLTVTLQPSASFTVAPLTIWWLHSWATSAVEWGRWAHPSPSLPTMTMRSCSYATTALPKAASIPLPEQ